MGVYDQLLVCFRNTPADADSDSDAMRVCCLCIFPFLGTFFWGSLRQGKGQPEIKDRQQEMPKRRKTRSSVEEA